MNTEQTVIVVVGAFFVGLGGLVTFLFRRAMLSMRYWAGWLFTAACMAFGSALTLVFGTQRDWYWSVPLVVAAPVILLISVQLSVSISGHRRLIIRLAQEVAELTGRLDAATQPTTDARPLSALAHSDQNDEHAINP